MGKLFAIFFFISMCGQINAQESVFLRVYGLNGKKISKGHFIAVSDTNLQIKKGKDIIQIPVRSIGIIKTKHSGWNNVLIGTSVGMAVGGIFGATNPPTNTTAGNFTWAGSSAGEEFASGLISGMFTGALIGGITILFKNPKTFHINGDVNKWDNFKIYMPGMHKPKKINITTINNINDKPYRISSSTGFH